MGITLITGGARSGKSTFAEKVTSESGNKIVYIATAIACDVDMEDRIAKHKESRPKEWVTIERYKDFNKLVDNNNFNSCDTILLDCITVMISNLMFDENVDYDNCTNEVIDNIERNIFCEINKLLKIIYENNKDIIIVTNEVGLGLVPSYRLGSIFRDIQGRVNQFLSENSENVYFVVSGIPLKIK